MFNPLIIVTLATIGAVCNGLYILIYKREIVWKNNFDRRKTDIILRGKSAIIFALIFIFGGISIIMATTIFNPYLESYLDYLFIPTCFGGLGLWLIAFIYAYINNHEKET